MTERTAVWRKPPKRGPSTPLVLLLHGRGADETDLIDLADDLPPAYAYASLRAPFALPEGGYTWYESREVGRPSTASLRSSVEGVRAWLDGPATAEFNRNQTYVLGFSAGMMMAGALVLNDPPRFAGAVMLSGALALDAEPATPGRLTGMPIFLAHGTLDTMIPPERVQQAQRYLREQSGALLTERTYPRGHGIAPREIADIAAWLGERS